MRCAVLRKLLRRYNRFLQTRPILANTTTSAFLTGVGDVGCQVLWEERDYDILRTMRIVLYRIFVWGPSYTIFILRLERVFGRTASPSTALKKLVVDQFVWSPPSNCVFFVWMTLLEGHGLDEVHRRVYGNNFWDASFWAYLKITWPYWIFINGCAFSVVPLHLRLVWISCFGLIWNVVMSNAIAQAGRSITLDPTNIYLN